MHSFTAVWLIVALFWAAQAFAQSPQGMYFAKKAYKPEPLPKFAETRGKLPSPIYDEDPVYVTMYWKTWELAFRNFYEPKPQSGFVSQFIDAAFNQNIFLWDTCFLTMFCKEAAETARTINGKMWDPQRRFYFDLTLDGRRAPARTIAAYWTLLAGVAAPEQADALCAELCNPKTFGRKHRVPTVPADQPGFDPAGGYWRGAVWSPTNTMVIRGLERYGKHGVALEIALEHLRRVAEVFQATGTVWENYAPDAVQPGKPAKGDFVGWTGIVPILYFLEYAIGLKPDAPKDLVTWELTSANRCGCERYRFNGHTITLVAEPPDAAGRRRLTVESDGPFQLRVVCRGKRSDLAVAKGRNEFVLP